jgi:hypothetical protein
MRALPLLVPLALLLGPTGCILLDSDAHLSSTPGGESSASTATQGDPASGTTPTTSAEGAGSTGTHETGGGDDNLVFDLTCATDDLGDHTGVDLMDGSNASSADDFSTSCGGPEAGEGRDEAYAWTAPAEGCWVFDTHGSSFDTRLALYDQCGGSELACNDDLVYGEHPTSEVGLSVQEGEQLLVVVDGFGEADRGDFSLSINRGLTLIPDMDIGEATGPAAASGSTFTADTTLSPNRCPWRSGADTLVRWTAPQAGPWLIEVADATFDSVLSVHRPCVEEPFVCDDQVAVDGGELLSIVAERGEELLFRVAGFQDDQGETEQGSFTLSIERG